ncbi:MAG: glycosyl hydrolase 115 family protein, partial [Bacillus sp. (in: firmicutes)]
ASNHLTMFPCPPELLKEEVEKAFEAGAFSYLLLNSGNIRPHLYPLDMVRELWSNGKVEVEEHLQVYISRLYTSKTKDISQLYKSYFEKTIKYGPHADDRAGEEFYHHPVRRIIGHWLQGKSNTHEPKLFWATGEVPFSEQVCWFKEKCESAVQGWEQLLEQCGELSNQLLEQDRIRFYDQFIIHVELHVSGCKGFIALCNAYLSYSNEEYPLAFVQLYQSISAYKSGQLALKCAGQGKWENFYRADWLTNIESTIYSLDTARKFVRMHGDSPEFFLWYKEYLMAETEKHIYLENTHRNPLSDDELAKRLEGKFFDKEE